MKIIIYDQDDLSRRNYQPQYETLKEAMFRMFDKKTINQADFIAAVDIHPNHVDVEIIKTRYNDYEVLAPILHMKERYFYLKEIMDFLNIDYRRPFLEYFKEELHLLLENKIKEELAEYEKKGREFAFSWSRI